tara:strand:+ start:176 stop:430 length:255 start_codon:yes stop_codon:yes gene_type:complete
MMARRIEIGSQVVIREWGNKQRIEVVCGIERTTHPLEKYGVTVDSVDLDEYYILTMTSGKWRYSTQVLAMVKPNEMYENGKTSN